MANDSINNRPPPGRGSNEIINHQPLPGASTEKHWRSAWAKTAAPFIYPPFPTSSSASTSDSGSPADRQTNRLTPTPPTPTLNAHASQVYGPQATSRDFGSETTARGYGAHRRARTLSDASIAPLLLEALRSPGDHSNSALQNDSDVRPGAVMQPQSPGRGTAATTAAGATAPAPKVAQTAPLLNLIQRAQGLWRATKPERKLLLKGLLLAAAVTLTVAVGVGVFAGAGLTGGATLVMVLCFGSFGGGCLWLAYDLYEDVVTYKRERQAEKLQQAQTSSAPKVPAKGANVSGCP